MNADDVRRGWATRSAEYSPDYYAYYGPNETSEHVRRTLDRYVDPDDAVLELGCSSGRHLQHLHEHGYTDLHGVDVNDDAFDVMAAEYPSLADAGTFANEAIESFVEGVDDGQYGAVFSVETLQHVHADETWVFEALARITDDVLVTVECEAPVGERPGDERVPGGQPTDPSVNYVNGEFPLYYRDWREIFTGLGLKEVGSQSLGRDTLRIFRQS